MGFRSNGLNKSIFLYQERLSPLRFLLFLVSERVSLVCFRAFLVCFRANISRKLRGNDPFSRDDKPKTSGSHPGSCGTHKKYSYLIASATENFRLTPYRILGMLDTCHPFWHPDCSLSGDVGT